MNDDNGDEEFMQEAVRSFALKQQIAAIHKEVMSARHKRPASVSKVRQMVRASLRIAAGLLLLLVGGLLYLYVSTSADSLYSSHYVPYTVSASRGGAGLNIPARSYFLQGQADLQRGKTDSAIVHFNSVLQENKRSGKPVLHDDAEYYLALSYLKAGQLANAIPAFKNIHNNRTHLYHEQVSGWYLFRLKMLALKARQ